MYRQQSLVTLEQFYELKPLSKLEAILSFIDFTLLEQFFRYNPHKRDPKGYSWKILLFALIAMQVEQIVTVKALVQRMKSDPVFKRCLGLDYLDRTASEAALNCVISLLAGTDIPEKTFRRMLLSAKKLRLIDDANVAIVSSKLTAYEHSVPKSRIPENNSELPDWGESLIQTVTLSNGSVGKCMPLWILPVVFQSYISSHLQISQTWMLLKL